MHNSNSTTKLLYVLLLLLAQPLIFTLSVYLYETYGIPAYLRSGSLFSLYALTLTGILIWTILLALLLVMLPKTEIRYSQKIALPVAFTIIHIIITAIFFQRLFFQQPVLFFATWIIPPIILFTVSTQKDHSNA